MGVWVDGQHVVLRKKRGAKEKLAECAAVPENVKLVFRVGKRRAGRLWRGGALVARAVWVVGMRGCIVLSVVGNEVRTAPTTVRQLCMGKLAAVPETP